jgi:hypothetical protein
VYLTDTTLSSKKSASEETKSPECKEQKLFVLQYPAHRPAGTPYNTRNLQKPSSLRLKPSTGLVELDIPIDTELNYNPDRGLQYATSLRDSRIAREGGTHGLSGGFNTSTVIRNDALEDEGIDIKPNQAHAGLSSNSGLSVQTLGGRITKPSQGDPIYLLGHFKDKSLHLSPLDAVVQVRPDLHHLDAADEVERNHGVAATTAPRAKTKDDNSGTGINPTLQGPRPPPTLVPPVSSSSSSLPSTRPESKAIDIKLKSNPTGPSSSAYDNDITTNPNAKLLRSIQQEPWLAYTWIDQDTSTTSNSNIRHTTTSPALHHLSDPTVTLNPPFLRSTIPNSEWLDLLSAPRIEHGITNTTTTTTTTSNTVLNSGSGVNVGDIGLLGKVRGRERERQRRKQNEAARRERRERGSKTVPSTSNAAATATATAATAAAAATAGTTSAGTVEVAAVVVEEKEKNPLHASAEDEEELEYGDQGEENVDHNEGTAGPSDEDSSDDHV